MRSRRRESTAGGRLTAVAAASALVAATLGWAPTAAAATATAEAPEVRALVLPLEFEGTVDEALRPGLDDAFAQQLDADGYAIDRLAESPGCTDPACYQRLASERDATHVVHASVSGDNRDYRIQVDLIDGKSGAVIATTDGFCDTCGAAELEELVVDKAVRLQTTLRSQNVRPATLVVDTAPAGAAVYLDGELIGETPLEHQTVAGTRRLRIQRSGFVTAEREVQLVSGVQKRVDLRLDAVPVIEDESGPDTGKSAKILKATGGAGIGVGVALLGAGIAMIVINDDPIQRKCTGDNVDADNDCKFLYDTMAGGIGLAAAGAVVAGVGVGLLVWGLKKGKAHPSPTARLTLTQQGLLLTGHF